MFIDNPEDLDTKLAEVQSKNKGHGYDEPKATPEKKPVLEDKGDGEKGGDIKDTKTNDDKGGSGKPPVTGEEEPPRDPLEGVEPPKRTERHIPIDQYVDEKKEWERKLADKEREIAERDQKLTELGTISKKPEETNRQITTKEEALKKYAEKYSLDPESVTELASILGSGQGLSAEDKQKLDEAGKLTQERKEADYFNNEFSEQAVPVIDRKWPDATPEQKAKAKQLLDEISHSKGFSRTPLSIILNGYEDIEGKNPFATIFGDQTNVEVPKGKRTMEVGRPGAGKATTGLTAKDLNSAKADKLPQLFQEMEDMPDEDKRGIVSDLDPMTYDRYVKFLGSKERDQGVAVNRDGRKIVLK